MRGDLRDINDSGKQFEPPRSSMPRRLAVIMVGDIAGYSRMMQSDEEATHSRVKRIERELIEPSIVEHGGRLIKTTGDGFIAMFDSPVEAVRCGIVIQQNLVGRNASEPRASWISYRIGVNLGDVIIEQGDVYGDGVNIAARLEGMAEPGQVYISGGVYEQIKHKIVCGYQSLGDRKVKNITEPVRVYRVLPDPASVDIAGMRHEKILIALWSFVLLIIAASVLWFIVDAYRVRAVNVEKARAPVTTPQVAQPQSAPAETRSPGAKTPETGSAQTKSADVKPAAPKPADIKPADIKPADAKPVVAVPPAPVAVVREPEMVALRGGSFAMGSNEDASERPVHQVSIKPFEMAKYPVTVAEWNACAAAKACGFTAQGKDDAPVTNVSWTDAKNFVDWLAGATGKAYRLPTEAEWEYAARGGTLTKYWWGDQFQFGMANCKNCTNIPVTEQPVRVGQFKPNPFGLYDMGGGVDQWVEDCGHRNYQGAPTDGSAWLDGNCVMHVLRSSSWRNDERYVRPANRDSYDTQVRYPTHGFRVARSL